MKILLLVKLIYDTLKVFLKEFFEKVDFEKIQQTTTTKKKNNHEKLPSMQVLMFLFQAPYLIYVEVLECENTLTCQVPNKILENTLRYTRSEEDLVMYYTGNTSPRDFSVYGSIGDFDDADCWSQEDDEIMQVIMGYLRIILPLTLKAPSKKCIRKCHLLKSSAANNCLTLLTNLV